MVLYGFFFLFWGDYSVVSLMSLGCHGNHVVLFLGTSVCERVQSNISVLFDSRRDAIQYQTINVDLCLSDPQIVALIKTAEMPQMLCESPAEVQCCF